MSTGIIDCARTEALFASEVQPSDALSADEVRAAVRRMVRRYGVRGCAAAVAYEFGEHPDTAAARMRWAGRLVAASFPRGRPRSARPPRLARPPRCEPTTGLRAA
jgi:hypothetical protein